METILSTRPGDGQGIDPNVLCDTNTKWLERNGSFSRFRFASVLIETILLATLLDSILCPELASTPNAGTFDAPIGQVSPDLGE